jgi:hypothetical protein
LKITGEPINKGTTKIAYTLKNHPDLLFLQLNENLEESDYIKQLKNEVEWINKFREIDVLDLLHQLQKAP